MKTTISKLSPDAIAFDKLYFINMLSDNPGGYENAHIAMLNEPRLSSIINALTPEQLSFLINKIEENQ